MDISLLVYTNDQNVLAAKKISKNSLKFFFLAWWYQSKLQMKRERRGLVQVTSGSSRPRQARTDTSWFQARWVPISDKVSWPKKTHASLLPVGTARLWGGSLEKLSKEETCSTINLEKETVALPTFFWSAVVPEEYANMELVEWKLEGMVAIPYLKPEQQPADLLQACWWGRWP